MTADMVAGEMRTYEADAFEDVLRDYWGTPSPWQVPAEHLDEKIENGETPEAWGDPVACGRGGTSDGIEYDLTGKIRATAWTSAYEDGSGYIVLANLVQVDYPPIRFHFDPHGIDIAEVAEVFAIYKVSEDREHAEPLEEWPGQLQNDLASDCIYLLQPMRPDFVIKRPSWTKTDGGWKSSPNARGEFWAVFNTENLGLNAEAI
jgi:hypothetical protein